MFSLCCSAIVSARVLGYFTHGLILMASDINNSEVLLGANIHRPDAPLASQEREESENLEGRGKNSLR